MLKSTISGRPVAHSNHQTSSRRPLAAALACVLTLVLSASILGLVPSASARTATVTDPVNTPAATDIRQATYADRESVAAVTLKIRHLATTGSVVLRVAPQDADVIYVATAKRASDGTITKQLDYVTDTDSTRMACAYTVTWALAKNLVRVRIPQACLKFGVLLTKHWMSASFRSAGAADTARSVNIGRGDSPGCVTPVEFRSVHRGQTKLAVHQRLDTPGTWGDGAAGGYSRVYKACGSKKRYFIEYGTGTDKVVGKGRVR